MSQGSLKRATVSFWFPQVIPYGMGWRFNLESFLENLSFNLHKGKHVEPFLWFPERLLKEDTLRKTHTHSGHQKEFVLQIVGSRLN